MLTKIEFREAPKVRRCRARASSLGIFVRSFVSFPLVFFPFYLLVAFIFLVFSVSSRFVFPFSFSVSLFCLACPNGSERKLQPPSNVSPKTPKTPRRFAEFSFHLFFVILRRHVRFPSQIFLSRETRNAVRASKNVHRRADRRSFYFPVQVI